MWVCEFGRLRFCAHIVTTNMRLMLEEEMAQTYTYIYTHIYTHTHIYIYILLNISGKEGIDAGGANGANMYIHAPKP
jgi:hypothetical protein